MGNQGGLYAVALAIYFAALVQMCSPAGGRRDDHATARAIDRVADAIRSQPRCSCP